MRVLTDGVPRTPFYLTAVRCQRGLGPSPRFTRAASCAPNQKLKTSKAASAIDTVPRVIANECPVSQAVPLSCTPPFVREKDRQRRSNIAASTIQGAAMVRGTFRT